MESYAEAISSATPGGWIITSIYNAIFQEVDIEINDAITLKTENEEQILTDQLFAYLRLINLMSSVYGIQRLMNNKEQLHEITVKTGVDILEFTYKLFDKPLVIDGKILRLTAQRKMKDIIRNSITKVLIFEAPFPLKDQYILQKLSEHGDIQTNKINHHQYKGTDIFNGVRSINFKKINKPIPTVLFIRGNRIKLRRENQDRDPICGVCKAKGHFRTECPQLPFMQEYMGRDRDPNDPDPPEVRTWAACKRKRRPTERGTKAARFGEIRRRKETGDSRKRTKKKRTVNEKKKKQPGWRIYWTLG